MKKILIMVPAFNEELVILNTLKSLETVELPPEWSHEIVVINDGSSDGTPEIVKQNKTFVLSHPFNCGVGVALRTGFKWARENNFDAAIQVDADGQHPVAQIKELIQALEESNADIVIGSRFLFGNWKTSMPRKLAMKLLASLASSGTGYKITDATSGFRISGKKAIAYFAENYPGEYLGDTVESLVLAHQVGLTIAEIPAVLQARQGGEPSHLGIRSSLHVLRVIVMVLLILFRPKIGVT